MHRDPALPIATDTQTGSCTFSGYLAFGCRSFPTGRLLVQRGKHGRKSNYLYFSFSAFGQDQRIPVLHNTRRSVHVSFANDSISFSLSENLSKTNENEKSVVEQRPVDDFQRARSQFVLLQETKLTQYYRKFGESFVQEDFLRKPNRTEFTGQD